MIQAVIPFAPRPGCQLSRWRRQVAARLHRPYTDSVVRQRAAMTYMANGPVVDGLVALERLVLIVLFDDGKSQGRPAVRLAGYRGQRVPCGVAWGGAALNSFLKDLRLRPARGARGSRLDLLNDRLLRLGLRLDRQLHRHERYPHRPTAQSLRLPPLLFAFRPSDAQRLAGDGPEFEAACRQSGQSANELLATARREHKGMVLLPLEWTSHETHRALGVFADLSHFPKLQVFSITNPAADLQGYQGAAQFDFYHSRFREGGRTCRQDGGRSRSTHRRRRRPSRLVAA